MSIGRITVDLLARTGSFETSLERAAKHADKRAKEIDAAVSKAGVAIGAALSAAGIAAVAFGKSLIDGLDALNDVADATGASIENLSALEDVAKSTGTNMDNVSSILVKFNNVLKEADGKNGASQALKALGLSAQELKQIDPAEALRQTAVALAGFADDGNKARLIQELFGNSIKDAAPFLKDLAEQTQLVGSVTAQQAEAAEAFNKQLFALQKSASDAGRSILADLLPAMTRFLQNAREIAKIGGFGTIVKDAARDLFGMGKLTGDNGADIKQFMRERERLQKDLEFATRRGFGTRSIENDLAENAKLLEIARLKQRNEVLGSSVGEDFGDAVSRRFQRAPSLPAIASGGGGSKKASGPKDSELDRYIEGLEKQLQKVNELTVAEKLLDDLRTGSLKLQKGESIDRALALAKQVDSLKAMAEYTKLAQAAEKEREDALLKAATTQEEQVKTLTEGNTALREEIEMIGKNAEAQAAIEAARISSAIAIKEQALAEAENAGALARTTDAIREQIRILTERKDLVVQKGVAEKLSDDAKKAEDFAKSVGAAFESSFEKAILEGGKLSDVLKGLLKDIAALYIRQSITGPLAQAIGGAAGGGGFDFGKILGGIGSWFGGFFADGGSPPMGKVSVVGENGPELFVPNTAGRIIPNGALGGGGQAVTVVQNFTVGDVATLSQVREAVAGSERRIAGQIGRSQRYGGALA